MTSRRSFMKSTAALGAAAALGGRFGNAYAYSQTPSVIPLFGNTLRGAGPGGIPVAAPDSVTTNANGALHYTFDVKQYTDNITIPGWTTNLWGYDPVNKLGGGVQPQKHLGGLIIGNKNQPIQLRFNNKLKSSAQTLQGATPKHILPNDMTIMGADLGDFRLATHFHGGLVPWISDGGPEQWFDDLNYGPGAALAGGSNIFQAVDSSVPPGSAEYFYPLNQSARFGWYHDHAVGITRLNAYAGVASGLIIRDGAEFGLIAGAGLPNYIENGGFELPLVIQDKIFVGTNTALLDPTWASVVPFVCRQPGSLWYAHTYEPNRWALAKKAALPPDPSVIPEFFGDTMLVNGTAYPSVDVQPRRYRLRLLNACSARFLNLQLYIADASPNGITLNAAGNPTNKPFTSRLYGTNAAAPEVLQIGTEGGFLVKPTRVPTNLPFNPNTMTGSLIVAPAERPDIIIDFREMAGKQIILYNDAPAPFPMGDPRNDYFPGLNLNKNPTNATQLPGYGPNSRVLMRFQVGSLSTLTGDPDIALGLSETQVGNMPGIDTLPSTLATSIGAPVRRLALHEAFDAQGRLLQALGPVTAGAAPLPLASNAPATEVITNGATEVWEVFNTTADVHPMHWHLVNIEVLSRQPFNMKSFLINGAINYTGKAALPKPNEIGLKETIPMYPGEATRILMKFDLPAVPFTVPKSPLTGGNDYVWHCHILEHEEHDMMRPLIVK